MTGAKEGFVSVDDARLFYTARGAGPPLILLHGGLSSGADWAPIAEVLADEFLVLAPDSRGHGRSTNPRGSLSYPDMSDDVAALISALELREPLVAGWSDGGQIALELAVRHPGAVGAAIIGGAYPEFVDSGLHAAHRALLLEVQAESDGPELAELRALHGDWPSLLEQTAGLWLNYAGLSDASVRRIEQPVLVLAGDRDELVGLDLALALYRALPCAEFAVVPCADHSGVTSVERGPFTAQVIADFAHRRI
jgi:pimeloyl-ACP methyl ester carboxylesterase